MKAKKSLTTLNIWEFVIDLIKFRKGLFPLELFRKHKKCVTTAYVHGSKSNRRKTFDHTQNSLPGSR